MWSAIKSTGGNIYYNRSKIKKTDKKEAERQIYPIGLFSRRKRKRFKN
jgi:hypothetical protein